MNLTFSPSEEQFREEVRDFLADELTPELMAYTAKMTSVYSSKSVALEWQAILNRKGWAAPSWPVEHGGCDWTIAQHYIFDVELSKAGAPPLSPMGIGMCGPALIGYGSKEQKAHYLPRILSGEDFWCQGYSEPHAGSDLAALSMSAERDGDSFVCNGTKIWTTHAHEANMMFCLVRTDASGKPQTGITFLMIDMTTPGVEIHPIIMLSGEHIQNSVFFQDVRVPVANVVGQIDDGWAVAKYLLEFERGGSSYGPRVLQRLRALRRLALELGEDARGILEKINATEIEASALVAAELMMMSELSNGGTPGLKASMMKIRGAELCQTVTEIGLQVAGLYGHPFQPGRTEPGGPVVTQIGNDNPGAGPDDYVTFASRYLNERAGSIYAGSNEIQRNILSKGQLGL